MNIEILLLSKNLEAIVPRSAILKHQIKVSNSNIVSQICTLRPIKN